MTSGSACRRLLRLIPGEGSGKIAHAVVISALGLLTLYVFDVFDEGFVDGQRERAACEVRLCRSGGHARMRTIDRYDYKCLCVEEPIDGR